MEKKTFNDIRVLGALLLAGATFSACSNDSNEADLQPVSPVASQVYKMTLEATKGSDNATTRALSDPGDGTITATWATTEKVYVKKGTEWVEGYLQPETDGATAELSGEFTGTTFTAGDQITLQFPKNGDISYDGQTGTLADIAANFDYATATATIASVDADNRISVSDHVSFVSQQAIVKFTLKKGATPITANSLVVTVGSNSYNVTPASATSELYVALPGFSSQSISLKAFGSDDKIYEYSKSGVTFENGKYYTVSVKMTQSAEDLALSGTFNIGTGNVKFSRGNLRATLDNGAVTSWSFAPSQDAYVGKTDANNLQTTTGTIDLFGWSTDYGYQWGIGSWTTDYSNFAGHFKDWGENPDLISNLGSGWFTMTENEWKYLFQSRPGATVGTTTHVRHHSAYINTDNGTGGVFGILLLPDGATFTADEATWGTANREGSGSAGQYSDAHYTKCTAEQWNNLEAKGAVFLPAAGYKPSEQNLWLNNAYYWSATEYSGSGSNGSITVTINGGSSTSVQKDACIVAVDKSYFYTSVNYAKIDRFAVRLVRRTE
ncbi:MAG: hypothetical protein IJR02_09905 [Bacteroidaceae bacterium]|nr:hypothetical protein [Bacteroidaceae bacterium]